MRSEDARRIGNAYDAAPSDRSPDRKLLEAMDVVVPSWRCLYVDLRLDLAKEAPWGFPWWPVDDELTHPRRASIADHLYSAVQCVPWSLIEARYHLLELHQAHEDEAKRHVGLKATTYSHERHFEDHLPLLAAKAHIKALVRALGTAFDCAAAAVVGIAALPKDIKKADMPMVLEEDRWPKGQSNDARLQREILENVARVITSAGPTGWHRWFSDLRNTFIHRPGLVDITGIKCADDLDRDGDVVVEDVIHRMPAEPALSDLQSFQRAPDGTPVLDEKTATTMDGLFQAATNVIEELGHLLRVVWAMRREQPSLLKQPALKQWREDVLPTPPHSFAGFAPGSAPFEPAATFQDQPIKERLAAAALTDSTRAAWKQATPSGSPASSEREGSASGSGTPPARPAEARATPTVTGREGT